MANDASGNLAQQTDAKGQVIVFTYDALNRPTEKRVQQGQARPPVTRQAIYMANLAREHACRQDSNTAICCPTGLCQTNADGGKLRSHSWAGSWASPPSPLLSGASTQLVGHNIADCAASDVKSPSVQQPLSVSTIERRLSSLAWHYQQLSFTLDGHAARLDQTQACPDQSTTTTA
jgi:YD repeat-containing protein